MSLTGSAAPLAQEATILPGTGSHPPTHDPLAGIPTAYGGPPSAASSGAPAILPAADGGARPGVRRGVVIPVAAVPAGPHPGPPRAPARRNPNHRRPPHPQPPAPRPPS